MTEPTELSQAPVSRKAGFFSWQTAWNRLVDPLTPADSAIGRRRRLLAWMLLAILGLVAMFVLMGEVSRARYPVPARYVYLMLGLAALFAAAYLLNAFGQYGWAAGLTVAGAVLAPWWAAVMDPSTVRGDFVPLAYTVISVLLSSMLLSPLVTGVLAAAQLTALTFIAVLSGSAVPINWPSLLILVFSGSVLSMLFSAITRQDLREIDEQKQELARRELGLIELSVRDHVTGLFNRRYLEESMDREVRRSARSRAKIGVLLIDVDQFKQVNDAWGHDAGDEVLQQLGRLFLGHIRGGDIACRYGGDEFVMMLPEATLQVSRQRAEHLCREVREMQLTYHGVALGPLTLSVGVAMYPEHGASSDALIKAADFALYQAKNDGKDRVAVAEALAAGRR